MAVLCRSWGLCWRSWAALGTFVGGPGPSWAEKCEEHSYLENVLISRAGARSAAWGSVLSCSWSLCWWSWAALGAYVGGLGLLLGPKLAVLGRLGAGEVGLGPKWSVLGGDQGRKVAQTRAGRPFWGGDRTCARTGPWAADREHRPQERPRTAHRAADRAPAREIRTFSR